MKNVAFITILIIQWLSISCRREEPIPPSNLDTIMDIQYMDSSGNDLLAPSTVGAYQFDSMRHFYVEGGILKEAYYVNADFPKQMSIERAPDSTYRLRIVPNTSYSYNYTGVHIFHDFIQLNSSDVDTIDSEIEFNVSTGNIVVKKVWYNAHLRYDYNINSNRFFVVLK